MDNDIASLDRHRSQALREHRLRRFSFRPGINADAQRVLADLARQLTLQLHGVEACELAFDRAANQWAEYTIRTDGCPVGDEISPDAARALLARLRATELGDDFLMPCPSVADARQIDGADEAGCTEKRDRFGNG
jgi:hypothetical protein